MEPAFSDFPGHKADLRTAAAKKIWFSVISDFSGMMPKTSFFVTSCRLLSDLYGQPFMNMKLRFQQRPKFFLCQTSTPA
jgi:hypothetical protein